MKLQKSTLEPEQKLSAPQKKFQKLCQKIEQEQVRLNEWQTAQADIQARASREILPTYTQLREIIFQQIQQLLQQKQQKMTAAQQTKLAQKIEQLSLQLLESQQMSAEQVQFLTELLNHYGYDFERPDLDDLDEMLEAKTESEFAEENFEQGGFEDDASEQERLAQLKLDSLKHFLCEEYDLDLDFFDFQHDPLDLDDFIEKFEQKMQEQEELDFLSQLSSAQKAFAEQQIAREKAKAAKKQQQREEAKKLANQSIKAIYLKITAWIHPDREQDEQKKQEKTVLMQQANQAYEANDLLTLLNLQIQLGQQHNLSFANQQLKAYNLLLEEQLETLQMQVDDIIYSFNWSQFLYSNRKIKVQDLYRKYEQDYRHVQQKLARAQEILEKYQDLKQLKQLMRSQYVWEMHAVMM
ncbi:hypothetical protein [Acinetobacter sp. SWBY1]|uniref:hypothetical protein n=1 Tax=Acinetobacter sp. SWBY1 TaxID=2079596 RepID=UPI000CF1D135|nr:hypothetical protein [Acinetobacter sp. SWBY1]AVH49956.1 hypothetical protein C3Y93_10290 [Acinetobacter sp. SWBY1]